VWLLLQLYEGICFEHVMFKAYQCVMNDDKVSMSLTLVSVTKSTQTSLQKTITGKKKIKE